MIQERAGPLAISTRDGGQEGGGLSICIEGILARGEGFC